MSAHLNLPSFTHPYSSLHPASALLPSFSFAHCADPYDPVGCYGFEAGDSARPERSHHSDLTPTNKSPEDGAGLFASQLSQLSGVLRGFVCIPSLALVDSSTVFDVPSMAS